MRQWKAASWVGLLGLALTNSTVAQELEPQALQEAIALVQSTDRLIAESRLQVSGQTADSFTGQLDVNYDSQRIGFGSVLATPALVKLRLDLGNGVVLEAEADLVANTRLLNGHGHALLVAHRVALQALTAQLERHLQPRLNLLAPHEDFLIRLVSYRGEAPVGWPLKRQTVTLPIAAPLPAKERRPPRALESVTCGGGAIEPEDLAVFGDTCESGEDEIQYFADACFCSSRLACHDAHSFPLICGIHGMGCESVGIGCDLDSDCLGRCGPGCGTGGVGKYTWDCADHDRCCRIHGDCFSPLSYACGDEFAEAADDFLYANDNCTEGCSGCSSNFDCGSCETCNSGDCVPVSCGACRQCNGNHGCELIGNCDSNGDCNDGNSCTSDQCVNCFCQNNPIGNCDSNGDCNDGNSCTSGQCVNCICQYNPIGNCDSNGDCNDGDACTTDYCQNCFCQYDPVQCGSCESCQGGACVSGCGPCETCQGGVCVSTCDSCESCQDGVCVPIQCGPCDECVDGVCVGNCGNGICEVACNENCGTCFQDCPCPPGKICENAVCGDPEPTGVCCLPKDPVCEPGVCGTYVPCDGNGFCACGQVAEGGGFCFASAACDGSVPCPNGSGDCPAGQQCVVESCCEGLPICAPACPGPWPCAPPPECEYCWVGTAAENNCPAEWCGTDDGCDCGCQFVDDDCTGGDSCPEPLCPDPPCDFCWIGTANENNCPAAWNGTSDGCDCGCQFDDPDCGILAARNRTTISMTKDRLTIFGNSGEVPSWAADGACIESTEDNCTSQGGDFHGIGSECTPSLCDDGVSFVSSVPPHTAVGTQSAPLGGTLWRTANNIMRLTFDGALPGSPTSTQVEILELLPDGNFGSNVSGNFVMLDEGAGVLKLQETGTVMTDRRWYAVRSTTGWVGVTPFEIHFLLLAGDMTGDAKVNANDVLQINALPTCFFGCDDDLRADVDGDGRVNANDVLKTNSLPTVFFPPTKPSGH